METSLHKFWYKYIILLTKLSEQAITSQIDNSYVADGSHLSDGQESLPGYLIILSDNVEIRCDHSNT
jgi:hypothetical protein